MKLGETGYPGYFAQGKQGRIHNKHKKSRRRQGVKINE